MMRMLKIMFIILVGIGMLIMGIYEFIRLKKRRRKLKQLLDNIASGSTVDQLLKENHPKLSAMDEMEKGIYIIIGFGAGLVLFGAFFMAQELMERNVIPDMTGTTGWMLVQRLVAFASGIILLFTGSGMKKKQVKENDIILLHDIFDTSVDAAVRIVDALQQEQYEFVTVDELLFP